VVSNIGCTVLGHIQCVSDVAMLGVAIGGVHSHLAIIGFKIPLHDTTYLTISLSPLCTKILSHIDYDPNIIHKKFKEFKAVF